MCCGDCQLGAMQCLDCLCHNEGVPIFLVSVRCPRQCSVKGGNNYCIMVLSFERLRPFLRFPCCRKERKKKKTDYTSFGSFIGRNSSFSLFFSPVSAFHTTRLSIHAIFTKLNCLSQEANIENKGKIIIIFMYPLTPRVAGAP